MAIGESFLLVFLSALTGGGSVDLAGLIGPEMYWRYVAESEPSEAELILMAAPADAGDGAEAPDIGKLIDRLGAANYQDRQAAADAIVAHGAAVAPQLKAALDHDDPEVAMRVKALRNKVLKRGVDKPALRLMAVRTLGEREVEAALPTLRKLTQDDDPWLAEASKAAIARIEGKAYTPRRVTKAELASDLALMPEGCAVLGQLRGGSGSAPTLKALLSDALAGPHVGGDHVERARKEAVAEVADLLERTGNLRIDAVTIGVFGKRPDEARGMVVLRGRCDAERLGAFFAEVADGKMEIDEETLYIENNVAIWVESDRRAVAMIGPRMDRAALARMLPRQQPPRRGDAGMPAEGAWKLARAMKRGEPGMWVAADLTQPVMPSHEFVKPFDSVELIGRPNGKGGLKLELTGRGSDDEAIGARVDQFNAMRAMVQAKLKRQATTLPMAAKLRDAVAGVEARKDKGAARLTAEVEAPSLVMMMPMMMWSVQRVEVPPEAGRREAEAEVEADDEAGPVQRTEKAPPAGE